MQNNLFAKRNFRKGLNPETGGAISGSSRWKDVIGGDLAVPGFGLLIKDAFAILQGKRLPKQTLARRAFVDRSPSNDKQPLPLFPPSIEKHYVEGNTCNDVY